jgi:hypothetical protein
MSIVSGATRRENVSPEDGSVITWPIVKTFPTKKIARCEFAQIPSSNVITAAASKNR